MIDTSDEIEAELHLPEIPMLIVPKYAVMLLFVSFDNVIIACTDLITPRTSMASHFCS